MNGDDIFYVAFALTALAMGIVLVIATLGLGFIMRYTLRNLWKRGSK